MTSSGFIDWILFMPSVSVDLAFASDGLQELLAQSLSLLDDTLQAQIANSAGNIP